MRFTQKRFSVPFSALSEPMPSKAFKLLIYLLSISDFGGGCNPGYAAMRLAMRDNPEDKGSDATVRKYLSLLKSQGWIFTTKKTNSRALLWLQIPPRFRMDKPPKTTISVLH